MKDLLIFIGISCWLAGMVIAKGFWSTIIAILIPPYAWYLIMEFFLRSILV